MLARTIQIFLLSTVFGHAPSLADVANLEADLRAVLKDAPRFQETRTVAELPDLVVELFSDGNGNVADPGQEWRSTDVIADPSVPSKRLIWAAYSATYYVVHYERGGRGHSYHVLVAIFTPEDEAVSVAWRAVGGPFTDYEDFLNVLDCGALNDDPRYGY